MKKNLFVTMRRAALATALLAVNTTVTADTWTFYNGVWQNKTIADGTAHQYDADGNAVSEGGLTFCFQKDGLKNMANAANANNSTGMWFYADYDKSAPINYMKVSVPAKTKVTATGTAWGNRGIDFIMNGTTYKMRTDTFTFTNNSAAAKDLIIAGVLTTKNNATQVALYKLAIGEELAEDNGPGRLDSTVYKFYKPYGTSGPGYPETGDGRGGFLGANTYLAYKGNHAYLPIMRTDLWDDNKNSSTVVDKGLMPPVVPLLDVHIRDARVTRGGDGCFYMTGSTGHNIWAYADGIELWKSENLKDWEYMGLVWDIDKEADPWVKQVRNYKGAAVRAVWAPEIHYLPKHDNYYIVYSMCPSGSGILKSSTGKPEGPYVNALSKSNAQVASGIDPTLFEDEDGQAYLTYSSVPRIYRFNDDMSAIVGDPIEVKLLNPDTNPDHHGHCGTRGGLDICNEGAVLFKANGKYYIGGADSYEGRYSCCLAVSDKIEGPWDMRHETLPGNGGTGFFQDADGNWWTSYFGNDNSAPFREKPALGRVAFSDDGHIYPALDQPFVPESKKAAWETKWNSVWKNKYVTTGITNLNATTSKEDEGVYNLQGQRLSAVPAQGLYIQGGKKYLVK